MRFISVSVFGLGVPIIPRLPPQVRPLFTTNTVLFMKVMKHENL